jgi:hypothetical protein
MLLGIWLEKAGVCNLPGDFNFYLAREHCAFLDKPGKRRKVGNGGFLLAMLRRSGGERIFTDRTSGSGVIDQGFVSADIMPERAI